MRGGMGRRKREGGRRKKVERGAGRGDEGGGRRADETRRGRKEGVGREREEGEEGRYPMMRPPLRLMKRGGFRGRGLMLADFNSLSAD